MAEQAGKEPDHGAGHASHFDQQAEKYEQGHRKEYEMAHASMRPMTTTSGVLVVSVM